MIRNKVTALLLAVVFACTTFFTTTASANEVNTSLAANPAVAISTIDSIGTPLSDQAAGEIRGNALPWAVVYGMYYTGVTLGIAWYKLYPYAIWCYQNCDNIYQLSTSYWDAYKILKNQ